MNMPFSEAYRQHLKQGPFPGQVDPWAEIPHYFHPVHGGLIGYLLEQIQDPLEEKGFVATRETTLKIAERQALPDIFVDVRRDMPPSAVQQWDYAGHAAAVEAIPGVVLEEEAALDAIAIYELQNQRLVAVVEIVSPTNKTDPDEMHRYRQRRSYFLSCNVNFMEIDLTRSFTHLLTRTSINDYPYHALVYLPEEQPRLIGIEFGASLPRLALPLRNAVVPMNLQDAYDRAYQVARTATRLLDNGHYAENYLPFPTTLTKAQRQAALDKVAAWRAELERLKSSTAE